MECAGTLSARRSVVSEMPPIMCNIWQLPTSLAVSQCARENRPQACTRAADSKPLVGWLNYFSAEHIGRTMFYAQIIHQAAAEIDENRAREPVENAAVGVDALFMEVESLRQPPPACLLETSLGKDH